MTAILSSAGWVAHNLGLATSIGGNVFGMAALEPGLKEINDPAERDEASQTAWSRFGVMNLASHVAFAVPWFIGRGMLSGREVSGRARTLTIAKDILVGASLATGIASFVVGKIIGKKTKQAEGPERVKAGEASAEESPVLEKVVSALGTANFVTVSAVAAVTALLAMEGNKSSRFSLLSRFLP